MKIQIKYKDKQLIINLTILECKLGTEYEYIYKLQDNKSNHIGM